MKKILIRGANWIGDSVISIPVIKTVRQNYPEAYIGLVLRKGPAELLRELPYINKIYIEDTDNRSIIKEKFDLGIILTNSFSSAFKFWRWGVKERIGYPTEYRGVFLTKKVPLPEKPRSRHLLEEYFDILKTAYMKEYEVIPEFFIPERNLIKADEMLAKSSFKKDNLLVGVCPGATFGPAKIWPKERYLNVINYLIKEKASNIIIFGGVQELDTVNFLLQNAKSGDSIMASPDDDILTGAALMKRCKMVISNDTGPMHIASSLNIPVLAIFSTTDPVWTGPLGNKNFVLYKGLKCSPCFKRICSKKDNKYECLKLISEEEVIEAVESVLKRI